MKGAAAVVIGEAPCDVRVDLFDERAAMEAWLISCGLDVTPGVTGACFTDERWGARIALARDCVSLGVVAHECFHACLRLPLDSEEEAARAAEWLVPAVWSWVSER